MTESLAAVSDLEPRLRVEVGSLAGADLRAAELAIEDASIEVAAAAAEAGLSTPWTAETVPALAKRVVIGAALRTYKNPDGNRNEQFAAGAYGYGLAEERTSAYLTEDELAMITRAVSLSNGGGSRKGNVRGVRTPSGYSQPDPDGVLIWPPRYSGGRW